MQKVHTNDQKGIRLHCVYYELNCLYKHHFDLLFARSKEQ